MSDDGWVPKYYTKLARNLITALVEPNADDYISLKSERRLNLR